MREPEVLVRFRPSGRETYVLPGTRLVEAAAEAGILLEVPCGGEGLCGKCRVIVASGAGEPSPAECDRFSAEELHAGWRLACQSAVVGPAEVEIPAVSQAAAEHKILVHTEEKKGSGVFSRNGPQDASQKRDPTPFSFSLPPVWKRYVELVPPARGDEVPDVLRLQRELNIGPLEVDLSLLRELPARLRQLEFRGTAVLRQRETWQQPEAGATAGLSSSVADTAGQASSGTHRPSGPAALLDFEPGNTEAEAFAVALDIGTTTLVGTLLELDTGNQRAIDARLNPQTGFGDDVLSRIQRARQDPAGLRQLQAAIVSAVDEMIGQLCSKASVPRDRIYELAVAGNTTMQQLLCGIDPRALGEVPFTPAVASGLECLAVELGLHVHPRGGSYVMPVIGGFVGGDTVAGILATGLAETERPTLLVDIGTNGEIVLAADGKLSAASTAAGPAFEGARISRGMRGSTGAIEKVIVDGRLRTNVIGNVPPLGLCGSGLIDLAAELLRHRLLTPQGRLQTPDQLPADVLPDLSERVVLHEGQVSFVLAGKTETADGRPIAMTQRDVRELQLATGAIRAGVAILLRRAGLTPKDLDRVLIAGGFGNFIRRSNAQRIGLLPHEIEHWQIRFVGNTSLAGAQLAALSLQARELAESLARRTQHVDLSTDADFHRAFAEAMTFPAQ